MFSVVTTIFLRTREGNLIPISTEHNIISARDENEAKAFHVKQLITEGRMHSNTPISQWA